MHQMIGLPYGTYSEYMNFNGALWFLPCLFTTDMLFSIVKKYAKLKEWLIVFSYMIFFFCVGTYLMREEFIFLPFGLNTACFALTFYVIGYVCRDKIAPTIQTFRSITGECLLIVSLIVVQIQCIGVYNGKIDKTDLTYVILALVGIVLCISLSRLIRSNRILEYLGKNSLIIFAFQEQTYRALLFCSSYLFHIPVEDIRLNFWSAFVISVITITCITPFIFIWNKWVLPIINKI